jgi:uracil-DNA glycosylase family 4
VPATSHLHCRHKRWGDSAVLVFRLAATLALRHEGRIEVWNDPHLLHRQVAALDPLEDQTEHLGWTHLRAGDRQVFLANDGRVLRPEASGSLWERFMRGESEDGLLSWLENELGLSTRPSPPPEPPWREEMRACRQCFEEHPDVIYAGPEGEARPLFDEQGDPAADLLLVAEAPNFEDTFDPDKGKITLEAHTDPTGAMVYRALTEVLGLSPSEVLFTNAVLCLPARSGGKYPVKAAMRKACSGHLRRMIQEVDPRVVVTLGDNALQAVKTVETHHLKLRDHVATPQRWFDRLLFPLYHPSMLGRVSRPEAQQLADWCALRDVLLGF